MVSAAVFGAPVQFDEGQRAWDVQLAASASADVIAVWRSEQGLRVARSAGGPWRVDTLEGDPGRGRPLVIVSRGGEAVIAVETRGDGGHHDLAVWRAARMAPFSPPQLIPSGSTLRGGQIRPSLALTHAGRVLLTWTRRKEREAGDVMLATSTSTSASTDGRFSAPRRLGRSSRYGAVVTPAGDGAVVSWLSGSSRSGVRLVLVRRLDGRGRPVGPRSPVARGATLTHLLAGRGGGPAVIAWSSYEPRSRRHELRACRLAGTPARCVRRTRLGGIAGWDQPTLVVGDQGRAAIAWVAPATADRSSAPRVAVLGARWSPARELPVPPWSAAWEPTLVPVAGGGFLAVDAQRVFRLAPGGAPVQVDELVGPRRADANVVAAAGGELMALATTDTLADDPLRGAGTTIWLGGSPAVRDRVGPG